ncbi:L,D-transpeptidase [Aestuariivirga litoralis]|uniref:L,D-transpeptidase n=1 Tax=Aestuariivirga litoralis TaxID=2650924 RepID=UPI0018C5E6D3|nr:L,D-transpeptidase [Aestuariivirga litoralis]MBG1231393.1 L,D-transpeptidase [Aestuariivirga litoralis]
MLTRRNLLASSLATLATAPALAGPQPPPKKNWVVGTIPDTPFSIDLMDMNLVLPQFQRQVVRFTGAEPPGSLVVDPPARLLYWVQERGVALRFGTAVGREGAAWSGSAVVGRKAKWPTWTPTASMRQKNPALPVQMPGGPANPLGCRALYLYQNGIDTLYRIHGTNDPSSIGKNASSGCIRMFNECIFELFAEVPVGTRVVVR